MKVPMCSRVTFEPEQNGLSNYDFGWDLWVVGFCYQSWNNVSVCFSAIGYRFFLLTHTKQYLKLMDSFYLGWPFKYSIVVLWMWGFDYWSVSNIFTTQIYLRTLLPSFRKGIQLSWVVENAFPILCSSTLCCGRIYKNWLIRYLWMSKVKPLEVSTDIFLQMMTSPATMHSGHEVPPSTDSN